MRHGPDGLDTLACRGLDDFGGLDLDAVVVERIGAVLEATAPSAWQRLSAAATPGDQRHRRMLWDDARQARETLSREPSAGMHCVLAEMDVHVTREEFEAAAAPLLARTVDLAVSTLREARVTLDVVAGWFLVGGASRIPLVATLLHRATGQPPVVLEDPQVVVAEGALHAVPSAARSGWTTGTPAPVLPLASHPPASPAPAAPPFATPTSSGPPFQAPTPSAPPFSPQSSPPSFSAPVSAAPSFPAPVPPMPGYGQVPVNPIAPPTQAALSSPTTQPGIAQPATPVSAMPHVSGLPMTPASALPAVPV